MSIFRNSSRPASVAISRDAGGSWRFGMSQSALTRPRQGSNRPLLASAHDNALATTSRVASHTVTAPRAAPAFARPISDAGLKRLIVASTDRSAAMASSIAACADAGSRWATANSAMVPMVTACRRTSASGARRAKGTAATRPPMPRYSRSRRLGRQAGPVKSVMMRLRSAARALAHAAVVLALARPRAKHGIEGEKRGGRQNGGKHQLNNPANPMNAIDSVAARRKTSAGPLTIAGTLPRSVCTRIDAIRPITSVMPRPAPTANTRPSRNE